MPKRKITFIRRRMGNRWYRHRSVSHGNPSSGNSDFPDRGKVQLRRTNEGVFQSITKLSVEICRRNCRRRRRKLKFLVFGWGLSRRKCKLLQVELQLTAFPSIPNLIQITRAWMLMTCYLVFDALFELHEFLAIIIRFSCDRSSWKLPS